MRGALVLFTRDLRVRDHQALAAAVRDFDVVVPAFVLDRQLLRGSCGSPNRLSFLLDCLEDLRRSLAERGAGLVLSSGDVVQQALKLVRQWDLLAIYMSADITPYARRRHDRLTTSCERARVQLRTFSGVMAVDAGALVPGGGDHYRVFTPYWQVWNNSPQGAIVAAPRRIATPPGFESSPLPTLADLARAPSSPNLRLRGGESAARARLTRWLRGGLDRYDTARDELAADGTSQLSPYLHFGCLSVRGVLARCAERGQAGEAFARQLCWRDFHHQVLSARPNIPHTDYRTRGDRWREDEQACDAWRRGLTGYPIVDAGMRQLADEGFMHNRARMIVASFLTKTLRIDWRVGAAHFSRLLVDADVACNVGNWQWMAGTGNDTRPNRVLNPLRQARRLDPNGNYVRRHVPELAHLPGGTVHEPWLLRADSHKLNLPLRGYPAPIANARFAL